MDYFRALLIRLHVVLGVLGGLFFTILGLTGAALAFRPSIESRMYWPPDVLQSSPPASRVLLGKSVADVTSANPGMKVREVHLRPGYGTEIVLHRRDGSGVKSIYVDSVSGAVLRSREHSDSPFDSIYRLHTELMLGSFGLQTVSRLALLLMLQGFLGLTIWHLRKYPFHLHAVFGVSAGILWILLAYSGWRVLTVPMPRVTPVVTLRGIENLVSLDQLVETVAKRRAGVGKIATIYFPQAPSQPYQFWFGERPSDGVVYMDPYGYVLPLFSPNANNVAQDWHSGPAGGTVARLLRLFAGIGLAGSFVSGLLRVLTKRAAPAGQPNSEESAPAD